MAINDVAQLNGTGTGHSDPKPVEDTLPPALLHRSLHQQPYKVTSAKRLYLTLSNGRVIMDACGGAAVASIGHGNKEVLQAIQQQMSTGVSYIHSLTYTSDAAEDLAHHLIDGPQGAGRFGLERAYFVNSGSEAMDAALKLARQYWFEQGQVDRTQLVARKQSYHGTTIGAMNVSSNLPRKVPYACYQLGNVSWVSPAYAYQYSMWQEGETEERFAERLVEELDRHFQDLGPKNVIAFIAEPLVGATSGCTPAPKGYFKGVRRVCDKYSILLILDEIMSGMGRTGTQFAFEQEDVVPDMVTIGKGLGGGYSPVAGVLVHKKVLDVLRKGTSSFNHGHTYQAHPVACAGTLAVQKIIRRDGLIENCARLGKFVYPLLVETFGQAKYVGNIRGRGLFWGIEFVQDKAMRTPFPSAVRFGPRMQEATFELGVAIYPGSATVDGTKGDHVILSPPYNVTEDELRQVVAVMKQAYDRLEKEVDEAANGIRK
ncbi:pyridoxal phosphate-dependent transferase [Exophiala viscosa]|uniref:pyridoxal phosphate-dependent transferase n=1 Tax=Exophiala viscosa TaxID=2486360 RepID=UPI00219B281E|nr:pyridoxal phosphate-dependent transferase [Exophiala viscosa]